MENGNNNEKYKNGHILTWDEVEKHRGKESRWIVIDNNVYDVTEWQEKHPGGARILGHFASQDATVSKKNIYFIDLMFC